MKLKTIYRVPAGQGLKTNGAFIQITFQFFCDLRHIRTSHTVQAVGPIILILHKKEEWAKGILFISFLKIWYEYLLFYLMHKSAKSLPMRAMTCSQITFSRFL